MNSGKVSFKIMQYCGIWRPKTWTSPWAICFYNLYTILIVAVQSGFGAMLFLYILQGAENLDALTETIIILCAVCSLGIKISVIFLQRDEIIDFDDMLVENGCTPRNQDEYAIKEEFERKDRFVTILLVTINVIDVTVITLSPLARKSGVLLPCDKIWFPESIESNKAVFLFIYFYQAFSLFTLGFLLFSYDCFISGMMLQICNQLQIFEHRIQMLSKLLEDNHEKPIDDQGVFICMKEWVIHHLHVYSIGEKLSEIFSFIIFMQFFVTIMALCTVIYQLSKMDMFSLRFWYMVGCLNNYMMEIFLFCWFGEKMKNKSIDIADSIYKMNWNPLTPRSQRCLILIMLRALRPIELVGASMVTMSLDTFVKILKTSYSVFSVMKSASN